MLITYAQVSSFVKDHLPHGLSKLLLKGWPVDEALRSSFALVNERMETQPESRGDGCQGCSGSICGVCSPACGFDAYNSGSTAIVAYLKVRQALLPYHLCQDSL
jgi:hypothetical protein